MFEHSAINELFMSAAVSPLLSEVGHVCANSPLGWLEYAVSPDDPMPDVHRCCGVFETLGDRRLGDHVLRGLELLLGDLVSATAAVAIAGVFPPGVLGARPQDNFASDADATHMQLLCGAFEDPSHLANIRAFPLQLTVDSARFPALAAACTEPTDLLGALYWRLGWECGRVMAALQRGGVCWGTFRDATGMHCNAHSNNFALIVQSARSAGAPSLLAPLDLDFAFFARHAGPALGDQVQELLAMEPRALAMDLSCSPDSTGTKNDHTVAEHVVPLRWALRDTMLVAYLTALSSKDPSVVGDDLMEKRYPAICELLQWCNKVSADVVG